MGHLSIRLTVMLLASVLLAACDARFTPASRIESPRILALRADQPFARPGEEVTLELLVANPREEALSWAFGTCTLPQSSTVQDCIEHLDGELTLFAPESAALSLRVPIDLLDDVPSSQRPSALLGVVVVACPGELATGSTLAVPLRCLEESGRARSIDELEVGVKRIFVRERDRNANPVVAAVTWDGEPWGEDRIPDAEICTKATIDFDACSRALRHRIGVQTSAPEAGSNEHGGDFEEQVIVQLYSTHGLFRDQVRIAQAAETEWVAQAAPDSDDGDDPALATLWLVARDDRGGVGWAVRHVRLIPPR